MILKKLFWMIGFIVGWFTFATAFQMVVSPIVYTLMGESPSMTLAICQTLGFMTAVYATYLNKLRNDTKRREYLIATRRQYESFKTNALFILKSKDFRMEAIAFAIGFNFVLIRSLPEAIRQAETQGRVGLNLVTILLMELVFAGVFTGVDLLLHNAVHTHWLGAFIVPDDPESSEEAQQQRREQNTLYRRSVFQFVLAALIFVCYFINTYAVTFPVMVTPPLFLFSAIYNITGIREQKNKHRPIRTFVLIQSLSSAVYLMAFLLGVFAPR